MKKAANPRQVKVERIIYGTQNLRDCMKAVMKIQKKRESE